MSALGQVKHEMAVRSTMPSLGDTARDSARDQPPSSFKLVFDDNSDAGRRDARNGSDVLALVEETCGALRQAHERIHAIEANAREMMHHFEARLKTLDSQKKNAEARAAAAEAKVAEAEGWLARIHDLLSREVKR